MFLRVDTKTKPAKTLAKARLVKGSTPAAKANKLIQALDKNPTNSKLVLSNYSRATVDTFPPIQAWEDKEAAVAAIRAHTFHRGKDKQKRTINPKCLTSLTPWNANNPRPNKPKTAPWESLPKVQELRLEGWTWKAIGQEIGCKASTARYMVHGMSKQVQATKASLKSNGAGVTDAP